MLSFGLRHPLQLFSVKFSIHICIISTLGAIYIGDITLEILNRILEVKGAANLMSLGTLAVCLNYLHKFLNPFITPILSKTGEAIGEALSDKIKRKIK